MAITGINNSSYTSYYASNYKNTVKKTDSEKDSTNTKDGNVTHTLFLELGYYI